MNVVILIESHPAEKAYHQCNILLEEKHHIDCVFFYGNGVLNATQPLWQEFAIKKNIKTYACVKSVEERHLNTHPIEIAGLSTFIALALSADKVIQFKADML